MILELDKLDVSYATRNGPVHAVEGVDLAIGEDEVLGLAGESGCGKTTLIKSLLRLLPSGAKVRAEALRFKGRDLSAMSDKAFRREIMWNEISLVPQSAQASLNPVYRVGDQIVEAIREHTDTRASEAVARVEELFDLVGLEPRLIRAYPHEFSGGMRQRAMIAMALALDPALVVMDEPTTGLDPIMGDIIDELIVKCVRQMGATALSITHDMASAKRISDRIAMLYGGRMIWVGPTRDVDDSGNAYVNQFIHGLAEGPIALQAQVR